MTDQKYSKGMYCGVAIEKLTREELEAALVVMSNLYTSTLEQHGRDLDMLGGIK